MSGRLSGGQSEGRPLRSGRGTKQSEGARRGALLSFLQFPLALYSAFGPGLLTRGDRPSVCPGPTTLPEMAHEPCLAPLLAARPGPLDRPWAGPVRAAFCAPRLEDSRGSHREKPAG